MANILHTVVDVLMSPSARKIDFHLGLIHVDVVGLMSVGNLILAGAVKIDVTRFLPQGVGAEYDNASNTLKVPSADYGARSNEKATIVHECVHALHDVYGGGFFHPRGGSRYITASENEAAAYVAGDLYHLYETGRPLRGSDTVFFHADKIAKRIMNQRGAFVSTEEAIALRKVIVDSPTYKIGFSTPTGANGL
jgi:hypothetical protein